MRQGVVASAVAVGGRPDRRDIRPRSGGGGVRRTVRDRRIGDWGEPTRAVAVCFGRQRVSYGHRDLHRGLRAEGVGGLRTRSGMGRPGNGERGRVGPRHRSDRRPAQRFRARGGASAGARSGDDGGGATPWRHCSTTAGCASPGATSTRWRPAARSRCTARSRITRGRQQLSDRHKAALRYVGRADLVAVTHRLGGGRRGAGSLHRGGGVRADARRYAQRVQQDHGGDGRRRAAGIQRHGAVSDRRRRADSRSPARRRGIRRCARSGCGRCAGCWRGRSGRGSRSPARTGWRTRQRC